MIALLLLIVLLPLAVLAAVGVMVAREERGIQEHRMRELLRERLVEVDASIARMLEERRRELMQLTARESLDPESLREVVRETPAISAIFVLGEESRMLFPSEAFDLTDGERAFLERSRPVWEMGIFGGTAPGQAQPTNWPQGQGESSPNVTSQQQGQTWFGKGAPIPAGWHSWYWGNGTRVLFWQRKIDQRIVGAELDRARLMADIIGVLPQTEPESRPGIEERIRLLDANGEALYQWGRHEPQKNERPVSSLSLSPPLQAWRIDYYVAPAMLDVGRKALWFNLAAGLAGCTLVLALLAVYFYRENSREMREAAQRVNFVNQVSHELKTPLTNIRMYAELMEGKLGEESDPKTRQYLDVIASESQRLSRLIANVLTFGRSQRGGVTLHAKEVEFDEVVRATVEQFRPALERKGMKIDMELCGGGLARIDPDALEQILVNLMSNVEKYAGEGGAVRVETRRSGDERFVVVGDEGPGIPVRDRGRIFEPFFRGNNRLNEGVSGTGIGLSIARDMARRHGGDLRHVEQHAKGAVFELRIGEFKAESKA